ncbi:hypothetical protein C4B68_24820 [Streptomyces dengpaensis]|uniref:Uncharacterized protein n=1 Tax=Streptomyces dengpaensis TaxID=2049881 RepID=A0ABM6SUZ3_9ACTN|nr:hypothetical protein C4B68_24820 [Streptomyces dengpaensis]PIB06133.1 hypothetical protein B1C81_26525 [Streptomyces sp. HG99]
MTCLIVVGIVLGLVVVPVWGKQAWGPEVWRWAGGSCPGGAYGFAVVAGLAVPLLFVIFALCLFQVVEPWKPRLRRFVWGVGAVVCVVTLEVLFGAIMESLPFGGGRHGGPGGTDTSRQYPALWAIGFAASLVGIPLAVLLVRVYDRLFPPRAAAS